MTRWGRAFYQGISVPDNAPLYRYEQVAGVWTLVRIQ